MYRSLVLLLAAASALGQSQPQVRYETVTDWETGFTGSVTISNTTSAPIRNWILDFDWDRNIDTIWDAKVTKHDGKHYTLEPVGWNSTIPVGGKITFGFNGNPGKLQSGPENMELSGAPITGPTGAAVRVKIQQTSAFSGGFSGTLSITNQDSVSVPVWSLGFKLDQTLTSVGNANFTRDGSTYAVSAESPIDSGRTLQLPITGTGALTVNSASNCTFNGVACEITVDLTVAPIAANTGIQIEGLDKEFDGLQLTVPLGSSSFALKMRGNATAPGQFTVSMNNSSLGSVSIVDNSNLMIQADKSGRAALRITETGSRTVRYIGLRILDAAGNSPGMPNYLSLGAVSEDTQDHLNFFQDFQAGVKNRRVDIRYIYLNGGPYLGWHTWSDLPGGRATRYIRNSRMLGMIPFFVWYNIPDGGESYTTNSEHIQSADYMKAYFTNLKLALDIVNQESPADIVGFVLEPDFLGYLAQNAGKPASELKAVTRGAYDAGVLKRGEDPDFPDTVKGLVQAINYTISKLAPQVYFGWQMNLWASPAGGWTTPVPGRGLIQKTNDTGMQGRDLIYREAQAITRYYMDAGIGSYGAKFVSIDKYGLDATGFESSAATTPGSSTWFWNNDHWGNYLAFVRAMHDTAKLPIVLWQLPVGHINGTQESNPYQENGLFPDLTNVAMHYEDSAPTYFLGDTFSASGPRLTHFSTNVAADKQLTVDRDRITWGQHMTDAASVGVICAMFGAGVGVSTSSVGVPPTDSYWWITKAQKYLSNPVPIQP